MTAVSIAGSFPKDSRPNNGLEIISDDLLENQLAQHMVVGLVSFAGANIPGPGQPTVPRVKFLAIEPLTGKVADQAREILDKARKVRGLGTVENTLFDHPGDDSDGDE